jgi:hypothetical protein
MTQPDDVRRHADGAIDMDFYRAHAALLRREARANARTMRKMAAILVAAASTVVLLAVSAVRHGSVQVATTTILPAP